MANNSNEADFLAQLSALESKKAELPKAAPPAKKKRNHHPMPLPLPKMIFCLTFRLSKPSRNGRASPRPSLLHLRQYPWPGLRVPKKVPRLL